MTAVARTDSGLVRGIDDGPTSVFRGIPFAAPPVGELRFAPPAPVVAWEGERDATAFGPSSLQNVDPLSMVMPGAERYYYSPATALFAEDCLYLNVVTPAADDMERPVLVWIHGGGFATGSGSGEWFEGTNLVTKNDVVLVTINYRLGILGNLYLGDLDPDASNMGLRDQVAALRWVRRNIARFGGDPANVTVFGQSAGGMSVASLMVSPLASGLFDRAIVQSGNASTFTPKDTASAATEAVIEALQLKPGNTIEQLRSVSTLRLLEVQRTLQVRLFPTLDGTAIPTDPLAEVRQGHSARVPLLIGTTAEELKLFHLLGLPIPGPGFDLEAALNNLLGNQAASLASDAARLYRESDRGSDQQLWDLAISDAGFVLPSRDLADAHASAGHPTFAYEFAFRSTALKGAIGSAHEVDVPFVFDALDLPGVSELVGAESVRDPATRSLAIEASVAWTTFARTGAPSSPSVPDWPRYYQRNRETVVLDRVITVEHELHTERLDFWQRHAPKDALFALLGRE
jgi:para-nitrobenzyl esterase